MAQSVFLCFYKEKNRSGTTSIVIVERFCGKFKELFTIGIVKNASEIKELKKKGKIWIDRELERHRPRLDLFGEERKKCDNELVNAL